MTDRDDLNARVTNAILSAERLAPASVEAFAAFHEVCVLEQSIARLTAPGDLEGEIARVGAVTAALSADEPLLAVLLANRYRQEALAPEVLARLDQLEADAHAELMNAPTPLVRPIRYTVRAA